MFYLKLILKILFTLCKNPENEDPLLNAHTPQRYNKNHTPPNI